MSLGNSSMIRRRRRACRIRTLSPRTSLRSPRHGSGPKRYPDYAVVLLFDGYAPDMMDIGPNGHTFFNMLLFETARVLLGGWHFRWEKLALGVWGLPKDAVALYGADIEANMERIPAVIKEYYQKAGASVEVEIATPTLT